MTKHLNLLFELGGDAHRFLEYLSVPFTAPLPWFLFIWPTNSPYKAMRYGKLSVSLPFRLWLLFLQPRRSVTAAAARNLLQEGLWCGRPG